MTAQPSTGQSPLRRWWLRFRGWLGRVVAALKAAFTPPEAPPTRPVAQRRPLSQPISVPARGFVFSFQIHIWLTWRSDDLTPELLDAWSQQFTARARRGLVERVADLARHFHPHQAAELEINLNRRLGHDHTYQRSGVVLQARPVFRVRLDDEVKEQLRPAYLQRLRLESEHEVALRRTQMVDQLTQRWAAVIEQLRRSPFAAAAAQLTDARLAEILAELVLDERKGVDLLAQRLRDAIHDSNRVGEPLAEHEAAEIIDLLNEALKGESGSLFAAQAGTVNGSQAHSGGRNNR